MPALNFKEKFAPLVQSGKKTQTIRQSRKQPIKQSDVVQLFTGQRTKDCRRIGTGKVKEIHNITIHRNGEIEQDGGYLSTDFAEGMAVSDGFNNREEFAGFFQHHYGLPFTGILIKWELIDESATENSASNIANRETNMKNPDLNYCQAENNCQNPAPNYSLFNPHTQQRAFVCERCFSLSGDGVDIFKPDAQPQPLATINEICNMNNELVTLESLAVQINSLDDQANYHAGQAVVYAAKCGEKLLLAKAQCKHGEFKNWLETNCTKVGYRQAANYMRIATDMPHLLSSNVQSNALLPSVTQAIALLSAPEEVKAEVTERIEKGESVPVREIEQLKRLSSDLEKKLNQQVDHAEALAEELAAANQEIKNSKNLTQSVIDAKTSEAQAQAKLDAHAEIQRTENEISELKAKIAKLKKSHTEEIDTEVKRKLAAMQHDIDRKQFALDDVTKKIEALREHEKALDKKVGSQIRHEKAIEKLTDSFDGAFTAIFDIVDDKDYAVNHSADLINKWEKRQKSLQSLDKTIQAIIDSLKDASEKSLENEEEIINAVSVAA